MSKLCICDYPGCDGVNHPTFSDKPDVHEDEHERRDITEVMRDMMRDYEILRDREQERLIREYREAKRPIVWPVGMIPIKDVEEG